MEIKNLPDYPLRRWIVARYDSNTRSLWFYGSWDQKSEAERIAAELGNGIVIDSMV